MTPHKKLDHIRLGWLRDVCWPRRFWELFWTRLSFTETGWMTTIAFGPLLIWVFWHFEERL